VEVVVVVTCGGGGVCGGRELMTVESTDLCSPVGFPVILEPEEEKVEEVKVDVWKRWRR